MPDKTKEELRNALKALGTEIENLIKFDQAALITLPRKSLERWAQFQFDLSEERVLWVD